MEKKRDPFYASGAWLRARQQALDRDGGMCVRCREAGRFTLDRHGNRWPVLADMVHHIQHYDTHPELALEPTNLISLCNRCHWEAHPEKRRRTDRPPPLAARLGICLAEPERDAAANMKR